MIEAVNPDEADSCVVAIEPQDSWSYDGDDENFPISPARGVGERKVAGSHHLPGKSHLKEIAHAPTMG